MFSSSRKRGVLTLRTPVGFVMTHTVDCTESRDASHLQSLLKNQALNENIDKVIRILRRNFPIEGFVYKSGFASEWLTFFQVFAVARIKIHRPSRKKKC
jgi:hypothetical protein